MKKTGRLFSEFIDGMGSIFVPPFKGLPFILWCFVVFSYIALPHNPIWLGDLPDPDDFTYLNQTLDWLSGQGWFDHVQHRMSPPEGVPIHYTRFAQLPIAAFILMFRGFGYSPHGAAMLTSFLLPVVYLGILFFTLRWAALPFVDASLARVTSFITLFASTLMFKFAPGQVDHHGLEAILTIASVGFLARTFKDPTLVWHAAAAGALLALATAISLEVLPWILVITTVIAGWLAIEGARTARAGAVFGIGLFVAGATLLTLDRASSDVLTPDILSYSMTYVALMGGIAVVLLTAAGFAGMRGMRMRIILICMAALALAGLYLGQFPALLTGPYGAMNKDLAALFFNNLEEAEPMIVRFSPWVVFLHVAPLLIGLGMSIYLARRENEKWPFILIGSLLTAAAGLALFYQARVILYAELFAIVPLAAFLEHGWACLRRHEVGRRRFLGEIALLLVVGPLTAVLLPALQDGRTFSTGVVLFPAQSFDDSCSLIGMERLLNGPLYAGKKLRIVNFIDEGPEILFRTSHEVMAAPYHTNVHGNLDAEAFFLATDMEDARKIAINDKLDLVVICKHVPDMYLAGTGPHYVQTMDGQIHLMPNASLAGQLVAHHVPSWMMEMPGTPNHLVFEITHK